MTVWLQKNLDGSGSIYSVRFASFKHNAAALLVQDLQTILSSEECRAFLDLHDYKDKLQYASRKHGWSSNADLAFIGQSIINCLHHLGKQHKQLRGHCLQLQNDHPHGPGAVSFYNVFGVGWKDILKDVQKIMPVKFCCGTRVLGTRLPRHFLNAEFVQWNACACSRLRNSLVSGSIPGHLVRNAMLQQTR